MTSPLWPHHTSHCSRWTAVLIPLMIFHLSFLSRLEDFSVYTFVHLFISPFFPPFPSVCLLLCLSIIRPPQSTQATKLQWSLDHKVGLSRDSRVSRQRVCVCVCLCACARVRAHIWMFIVWFCSMVWHCMTQWGGLETTTLTPHSKLTGMLYPPGLYTGSARFPTK